ncbi:hypothetical protein K504DRAFT_507994 [Pleomassaria siparia CBS 279.74]|uniref:Uncharacterized protein n=1 Tax=Pleomassaria siparia CBS 279.74 TaxID=1314801 RepID=A0A6G1JT52_9PLEO|nr:hypothetical protein K504DRAFT_507994 [Pleomassaria siparia CBS 279.74]
MGGSGPRDTHSCQLHALPSRSLSPDILLIRGVEFLSCVHCAFRLSPFAFHHRLVAGCSLRPELARIGSGPTFLPPLHPPSPVPVQTTPSRLSCSIIRAPSAAASIPSLSSPSPAALLLILTPQRATPISPAR